MTGILRTGVYELAAATGTVPGIGCGPGGDVVVIDAIGTGVSVGAVGFDASVLPRPVAGAMRKCASRLGEG
jgi:hypothetical protein